MTVNKQTGETHAEAHGRRKRKSVSRRLKHKIKERWRRNRMIIIAIAAGLFTAFYFMPFLIRFFTETD